MTAILCRRATVEDIPALAALRDPADGPADARMARYLAGEHHPQHALAERAMWIAFDGDAPVGYIAGHLSERYGCDGELQYLDVAVSHRGTGVAATLVRLLGSWFSERGAFHVCVDPGNPRARAFYKRHGAIELNRHWLAWPDMRKLLQTPTR